MTSDHAIHGNVFREFAVSVLERVGYPPTQAADAAEVLLSTSLRGVDTHGLRNLKPVYVDGAVNGGIKRHGEFRVEHDTPVAARANGDRGLGLAAACWGMRLALDKAASAGIGMVTMANSNHLGAAGHYAHMAVARDMIGVCMTGWIFAESAEYGVLPVFGNRPILGTNPMAIAFPCDAAPPFLLDMATSVAPYNRVQLLGDEGQPIPLGWGLDGEGRPTTDPALLRRLLPLGGTREQGAHKGFGLSLMVQILAGVLSGAWREAPDPERMPGDQPDPTSRYAQEGVGHFFAAVRLDQFGSPAEFKRGMDEMVRTVHAAGPEPGQERVYVPGEIEHETERARRRTGIPLNSRMVADLRALSDTYHVPLELASSA